MDTDIEKLHILLLDTKLPSTVHELKNPTEDFIINLIVTFLKWFKIDVNLINKPTFEQQAAMTCLEDNDIIGIINLYVVMKQICDQIFLPEFSISDITSCGSKKVRKFARYLANFILYATNKASDMEDIINEIRSKVRLLEELQEKKGETLQLKNKKAIIIHKQLCSKEKYQMEIQKLRSLIESNKNREIELEEEMTTIDKKRQKVLEDYNTHKLEIQRYDKEIADLKSEIVNSPDKYKTRLHNLEEQRNSNIEERDQMQEIFLVKNQLVNKYEKLLSFVQKQYEKFLEIKDTYEHLKKVNIQGENIKEQVDTMKNNISELIKKREILEDYQGVTLNEIHAQTEKKDKLQELHAQLLSDMKLGVAKFEEDKVFYSHSYMEKTKIQNLIREIEGGISSFIKSCQERYNNEVLNGIKLQKCFKNAGEGSDNTTL